MRGKNIQNVKVREFWKLSLKIAIYLNVRDKENKFTVLDFTCGYEWCTVLFQEEKKRNSVREK